MDFFRRLLVRGKPEFSAGPYDIQHGSKAVADIDLSAAALFDICLAENERRMAGYEPRLLRPQVVPRLIRFLRRFLRDRRRTSAALSG